MHRGDGGATRDMSIDSSTVDSYRKVDQRKEDTVVEKHSEIDQREEDAMIDEQEVNIELIPRARQDDPDCINAEEKELRNLKDFDTYEEVDGRGQNTISTVHLGPVA